MGDYTKTKSNFIKEKIKKSNWKKDRDYIDTLLFFEHAITDGILGWAGNMKLHSLRSYYEKEYIAIFQELDPERCKKYLQEKKEEEKEEMEEMEEFEREEKKEEEQDKKDWIRAGGKV